MRFQKLLQLLSLAIVLLIGHPAYAQSVAGCGVGNQDSTCLTPLVRALQTPPTCSAGAGWTTVAPAQWIGSGYTPPQCNYQAPPTCAGGLSQTSAPSWDGSSWVGLACQAIPPPIFRLAPDGNAYAILLNYCGLSVEGSDKNGAGPPEVWFCSHSLAGASRQTGFIANDRIGPSTFWMPVGAIKLEGFGIDQNALDFANNGSGLPTGAVQAGPGGIKSGIPDGGGEELFAFACPASMPHIVAATFGAFTTTNPSLIECGP